MLNKMKTVVFLLIVSMGPSCTAIYRNHGYVPSDEILSKVVIGIDTRTSVVETLGRPTMGGLNQPNSIYFIFSKWRHYGLQAPEAVSRQIVAIKFDASDVVKNVSRYGLEDGKVVIISRRITAGGMKEISFIRQLMGNFGRLDARDLLDAP